jgi:hypothetical protein
MALITRNTPGLEKPLENSRNPAVSPATFNRNILHKFRSFNYLFTLSACPPDALNSREKVIKYSEEFIIAKSSGKKINQLRSRSNNSSDSIGDISYEFDTLNLVESFNNRSPGRFDLFLNNVEIDTLMSFSETTNLAMATKIRFEVFESLSINGFIEALQVSSQSAGNYTYMGAPFILKVEFLGYVDSESGPSEIVENAGDQATRYLVINITKIDVDLNENGTRYRCQAVAHNELGYGDHNSLKEPIQMKGSTVYDVLKNLEESLNEASKAALIAEAEKTDNEHASLHDTYEIIFPTPNWSDGSFDYKTPWEKMKNAKIVEVTENPAVFTFPSPAEVNSAYDPAAAGNGRGFINPTFDPNVVIDSREAGSQYTFNANRVSIMFPKGAKIHDIIAAVVRDSGFGRDIISKMITNPKEVVNESMIEFVHIAIEVEQTHKRNVRYQRPVYKYRYVVLPYKMHYSRIPLFQNQMTKNEQENLQNLFVTRKYEYLYTGKNVDIQRFNLTFNHLFYQAYPRLMGNAYFGQSVDTEQASNKEGAFLTRVPNTEDQSEINSGNVSRKSSTQSDAESARLSRQGNLPVSLDIPQSPRYSDPRRASILGPTGNATLSSKDSYDALLKNMHQAILDNTGMIRCEIEILGDPYFFVTGGIGNYRPKLVNNSLTDNGEAPYQTNEVIIQIEFRNPEDIDAVTGFAKFNSNRIPFGGCFRVTKVVSKFSEGMFTQVLNLIRIPGQAINDVAPENAAQTPAKNTRINKDVGSSMVFIEKAPLANIIVPGSLG